MNEKNVGSLNFLKASGSHAYKRKGPWRVRRNEGKIAAPWQVTENHPLFRISAKARWERLVKEMLRGLYSPIQWKCHSGVLATWPKKCKGFFYHKMCGF